MNYKNKKNFGFVTLSFHIARNKNCFSRYDGIKPVLAAGRFSLFASLYLFTCFCGKFRNRSERNCSRKCFLQVTTIISIYPLKIKLNLCMYSRERKFDVMNFWLRDPCPRPFVQTHLLHLLQRAREREQNIHCCLLWLSMEKGFRVGKYHLT